MKESKKKVSIDILDKKKIDFLKNVIKSKVSFNKNKLPYGGHWVFFNENYAEKDLGIDGHPKRGNFFPKLLGYKRMFAGASLTFKQDIDLDIKVKKTSYIKEVIRKKKEGNNLYFIKVYNSYKKKNVELLNELQTIVFVKNKYKPKNNNKYNNKYNNDLNLLLFKNFKYDNIDLYRYSALTYNSHRIHYDLSYTQEVEGYKNLLVHGPLIATTVLTEIKNITKKNIINFNFSIKTPIFVNEKFTLKTYSFKSADSKLYVEVFKKQTNEIAFLAEVILD